MTKLDPNFFLTDHAEIRGAQRNITPEILSLVARHGTTVAGGILMRRKDALRARKPIERELRNRDTPRTSENQGPETQRAVPGQQLVAEFRGTSVEAKVGSLGWMGKMEIELGRLLRASSAARKLRVPTLSDLKCSALAPMVSQVYRELGGILPSTPLRLKRWDLEFDRTTSEGPVRQWGTAMATARPL